MFRHGSATRNAKYLTDSELKLMYGWTMDPRMPSVYIHLSGGDLDQVPAGLRIREAGRAPGAFVLPARSASPG